MAAQLGSSTRRLCAGSRRIGDGHRSCGSGAPLGASEHHATGRIPAGCDRRLASPPGGEPTRPSLPSHRYRARRSSSTATIRPPPGELRAIAPPPSPLALCVRIVRAHPPDSPHPHDPDPTEPRRISRTDYHPVRAPQVQRRWSYRSAPCCISQPTSALAYHSRRRRSRPTCNTNATGRRVRSPAVGRIAAAPRAPRARSLVRGRHRPKSWVGVDSTASHSQEGAKLNFRSH